MFLSNYLSKKTLESLPELEQVNDINMYYMGYDEQNTGTGISNPCSLDGPQAAFFRAFSLSFSLLFPVFFHIIILDSSHKAS